ncbi:hypothetical protein EMIHUDRAFT_442463 [Emiliania huxleyi CCMP1516]|uniref:Uncharacterized protein n=2 Tax=Emiliania huxleyi TaxID=2903 RepID=A0A0D3K4F8_EMIH1|nr:hypothetical protein EMIHUDRAFT_435740 [Emiliania huxleyi CCMP1516]XP_005783072.1 hypothetical protein EMIHUDRAFT_442463 [Emiliania huxleyi CCMP1516]EOD20917.1 hypothetical protein EMIHUDRAFT_435740 [Emiliania huxleyi CCMP1516]EOD30643.1 hypothetical protein EMIHUDRAFT_442463 [Emiliania huxleyi CCMP1516]|eukprot:XP_005773346.1 hypothetical protein EMIHUDRAFT_435740 [Emiliania huxleyi CCMP1516]
MRVAASSTRRCSCVAARPKRRTSSSSVGENCRCRRDGISISSLYSVESVPRICPGPLVMRPARASPRRVQWEDDEFAEQLARGDWMICPKARGEWMVNAKGGHGLGEDRALSTAEQELRDQRRLRSSWAAWSLCVESLGAAHAPLLRFRPDALKEAIERISFPEGPPSRQDERLANALSGGRSYAVGDETPAWQESRDE